MPREQHEGCRILEWQSRNTFGDSLNAPVNLPGEKETTMTTTTDIQESVTPGQVAPVVRLPIRFTFHGGPNDGQQLTFTPRQHQCALHIGHDCYVVRRHDSILLFSPRMQKTEHTKRHPDPRPFGYDPMAHE